MGGTWDTGEGKGSLVVGLVLKHDRNNCIINKFVKHGVSISNPKLFSDTWNIEKFSIFNKISIYAKLFLIYINISR